MITCIAKDGAGNENKCQFSIQVRCEYLITLAFDFSYSPYYYLVQKSMEKR